MLAGGMYEHRHHPLLPLPRFIARMTGHVLLALLMLAGSLLLGMTGYHALEGLSWLDAFLNAAMLLGGMGPVDALHTPAGKLFAGLYALYAGVIFLVSVGIVFTPVIHRLIHRFHLDPSS